MLKFTLFQPKKDDIVSFWMSYYGTSYTLKARVISDEVIRIKPGLKGNKQLNGDCFEF